MIDVGGAEKYEAHIARLHAEFARAREIHAFEISHLNDAFSKRADELEAIDDVLADAGYTDEVDTLAEVKKLVQRVKDLEAQLAPPK